MTHDASADGYPQSLSFRNARTQLLVSVRDTSEASLVQSLGVDWIDLKNPDAGSLGAADASTVQKVATTLHGFDQRSAAIGELVDFAIAQVTFFALHFPFVKVGLSKCKTRTNWIEQLRALDNAAIAAGARAVPVIYADHHACEAPPPETVLEVSAMLMSPLVLIDTFHKTGKRLLDWLKMVELGSIVQAANRAEIQVVLAGSLSREDLPQLLDLPVAAIAVRGAVCGGDRRTAICAGKVAQWVELFRKQ